MGKNHGSDELHKKMGFHNMEAGLSYNRRKAERVLMKNLK